MIGEELRELYQEIILDHGRHPRNFRQPPEANRQAHGHNPLCGDTLLVFLTLDADGHITDAAFKGKGCAISMASASLMTEALRGKSIAEAKALFARFHGLCTGQPLEGANSPLAAAVEEEELERLTPLSGVRAFPVRVKCATLAWHTMLAALSGQQEVSTE